MRLHEVERGDGLISPLLIRFISLVSGMRLPDAARLVFYHKKFFGDPMSVWTHAAMRGESAWTVAERELMVTMTAKWNACPFCIGTHGAIAARVLGRPLVEATLEDFRQAELPTKLQATLTFLEILTRRPDELTVEDAQAVLRREVTPQALEDAIAVCVLFHITTRCAEVVLQKIKAQQIESIYEQSPREKDVEHSPFLCGNDFYAVITCSVFSAQNFLQHYLCGNNCTNGRGFGFPNLCGF